MTERRKRTPIKKINALPEGKGPGIPEGSGPGLPKEDPKPRPVKKWKPITRADRVFDTTGKGEYPTGYFVEIPVPPTKADKGTTTVNENPTTTIIIDPVLVDKITSKREKLLQLSPKTTTDSWKEQASVWWYGTLPLILGVAGTAVLALGFHVTNGWLAAAPAVAGLAWMAFRIWKDKQKTSK